MRNVFRYRDRQALWLGARQPKWQQMLARSDANLIWADGGSVAVGLTGRKPGDVNMTWAAWRGMGFDGQSVVADPLFVRPECDDYRLKTGSPAWALGFQAIPVDRIGLFASPERASWPVRSDCVPREQPLARPAAGLLGRFRGWVRDQAVEWMPWLPEWRRQLGARPAPRDAGSERR
ncbi:MAG: hypothetical protein FJX72_20505 [Armatimonadetes bacterium]|nr:hypothetical protein [Armatimonadota bacterium]